ncbi:MULTISPECIES: inverse autotransporter beta domain-containing protein [Veillonella]|uniref:inverse autotransporter beta domain-containing protein n=1 Tax=Veillonella TaxID=29465 RepID=UPI0025804BB1|nr:MULTISPECIES: inverse autotransporter beta domain-containing protein [Veillonella]MBS6126318.1 inverse autotransporter beta domain-containing protein [Veillonella sp.]MDU1050299.1 inverse autotransporter beta domain-containing protein [Veillonella sp.]MDU2334483.1 inverse autotransporter beta domain-containing protein [Veillonella sp.]MDU2347278.1 inverse autotransporter beta domain-containing protein [Veillonella sp.]
MKRKLVLTSMILGVIVCSMSAVVRATDVAQQVSDTARHDAVQSNWMDRTDIAVGVQTGGQSKLDKGHFLTDDQNSIYNKQSDYGNLTKAYIETLHPISHYDENSKSVLFVQGRIGRGGEKIASKEMRGYFINEPIILRNGQLSSYTKKNTDEKSSETLGIIGAVGIGYRRLSRNEHAYVGVNAFVDRAFTGNYNRISGGVEYVNGLNEVYANVYRGLGDKDLVKGGGGNPYPKRLYPNGYPSDFPYHTIPSENYYTYKGGRALGGYEIGFARSFKNARWAHAYVNGYRWKGQGFGHEQNYNWGRPGHWSVPWFSVRDANHYKGIKIGAELQLTPHISLDIGYNNANNMSKGMYGTVKYTLGTSKFAFWGGKHSDDTITTARSKMLDKVRRQDMIVESFDDIEYDYLAPIDHL